MYSGLRQQNRQMKTYKKYSKCKSQKYVLGIRYSY